MAKRSSSDGKKGIKPGHYFLYDLDAGVIYSRFNESGKEIKLKGQSYTPVKVDTLSFGAAISDRRVYSPRDTIRIFVAAPGSHGHNAHLDVLDAGKRSVMTGEFTLDDYGMCLYELKGIEETGEYAATITTSSQPRGAKHAEIESKSFSCDFTVAKHTLSPLLVQIMEQLVSADVLDAELEVTVLNKPYTGSIKIGLYCDYCKQVINQKSEVVKNASFRLKMELSGHTGPFRLEFSTPDGNTASISLQSTRVEERQEIQVGNLGQIVNVALVPIPDGKSVRGVNWASRGVATAPVIIKSVESDKVELRVARTIDYLYVHVANPVTRKSEEISKKNVREGEEFSLRNSAPYEIIFVGCIINAKEKKLFEGRTIVFHPEQLQIKVGAPKKVEPSSDVTVTLETDRKTQCLFLVYDERLDAESIIGKLGKDIYVHLRTLGSIEELVRQFEAKREETLRYAGEEEAVGRTVGTGALPRPTSLMDRAMAVPTAVPLPMAKMAAPPAGASLNMGTLATVITASVSMQAMAAPRRAWFPELIACKLIEVDGVHEERVKLGDTITRWRVQVYAFADFDYISKSIEIEADSIVVVDIDVPSMIDEGDEYYGKAVYHIAEGKGKLRVNLPDGTFYEGEVEGDGIKEFKLLKPGLIEAELTSPTGSDATTKSVDSQAIEKANVSTLSLLDKGAELAVPRGKKVFVYGSVKSLISDSVKALVQYPFGCAEQTSGKLCGLAIAWQFGETTHEIAQMIEAGLSRMTKFLKQDGFYSLWEGGNQGSSDVTRKVLKNLAPLVKVSQFKEKAAPLVERPAQELLKKNVIDNSLLLLNEKFIAPISTIEDAANIAVYVPGKRKEALKFIESTVVEGSEGSEAHWEASAATWGGVLESTAMCLRALCGSKDGKHRLLLTKGFKFVAKRLICGRLHSTADTRALIELFSAMKDMESKPMFTYRTYTKEDPTKAVTKTEEDFDFDQRKLDVVLALDDQAGSDASVEGRSLLARSTFIARLDGNEIIDYKKMKATFNFEAKLEKTTLNLGERTKLIVTPKEHSLCPVLKVFLAANTAFLEGGVNIQTVSKPVTEERIVLDLVATSRGICKMYTVLYDMYDPNMVGVAIPMRITVT